MYLPDGGLAAVFDAQDAGATDITVARWDGTSWSPTRALNARPDGGAAASQPSIDVAPNGDLLVGFVESDGTNPSAFVFRWTAGAWVPIGGALNGDGIDTLGVASRPFVNFDSTGRPTVHYTVRPVAIPESDEYLRVWNGSSWGAVDVRSGAVNDVAELRKDWFGTLLRAQLETNAGGIWGTTPHVSMQIWNGSMWLSGQPLATSSVVRPQLNPAVGFYGYRGGPDPLLAWEEPNGSTSHVMVASHWSAFNDEVASNDGVRPDAGEVGPLEPTITGTLDTAVVAWSSSDPGGRAIHVFRLNRVPVR